MQHYVERDIEKILLSKDQIEARVGELGEQISNDYEGKDLIAVGILRGSVVFFSDLMRQVKIPKMCIRDRDGGAQYKLVYSTGDQQKAGSIQTC